jgi:transposase
VPTILPEGGICRDINAAKNIKRFALADALVLKRPVGQQLFELKLAELAPRGTSKARPGPEDESG